MNQDVMQQLVTEVKRLQRRVGYLERLEKADGKAVDYSSLATIVGWSSYTTKVLSYTRVGKLVMVQIRLEGTSNSATTTVTLPFPVATGLDQFGLIYAVDNGGTPVAGKLQVTGSILYLSPALNAAYTGWTASGAKTVRGQFFYFAG
jgi:hypothetical protein